MNIFTHFGSFCETSRRFDLSSRSLGHMIFSSSFFPLELLRKQELVVDRVWLRYVDDTFVKIHEYDVDGFTAHINSIDSNIQFTTEPELNNKLHSWIYVSM